MDFAIFLVILFFLFSNCSGKRELMDKVKKGHAIEIDDKEYRCQELK